MLHFVISDTEAKSYQIFRQYLGMHLAVILINMLIIMSPFILKLALYIYKLYKTYVKPDKEKEEKKEEAE